MHDFKVLTTEPIKEMVKETVDMAEKVGVTDLGEIQELIATTAGGVTEDTSMEKCTSKPVPGGEEDMEEAVPENNGVKPSGRRVPTIQDGF